MSIKLIKIEKVSIKDKEYDFIYKNGKNKDNPGKLRGMGIKVADDCPNFAGKWINMVAFADPKHTTQQNADYFKSQNEGTEVYLDVVQDDPYTKDGVEVEQWKASKPSKAKLEGYLAALEELKNQ